MYQGIFPTTNLTLYKVESKPNEIRFSLQIMALTHSQNIETESLS
jgi:hypothetical protein